MHAVWTTNNNTGKRIIKDEREHMDSKWVGDKSTVSKRCTNIEKGECVSRLGLNCVGGKPWKKSFMFPDLDSKEKMNIKSIRKNFTDRIYELKVYYERNSYAWNATLCHSISLLLFRVFCQLFFWGNLFVVHALLNISSTPSIHWIEQVLNSKQPCIRNLNLGQCHSWNPWSVWLTKKTALFLSAGGSEVPIVLVGNKSDLSRQVSLENVLQTKAEFMNNCPYIETSAKFNLNVIKLFIELLQVSQSIFTCHVILFSDVFVQQIQDEVCWTCSMIENK